MFRRVKLCHISTNLGDDGDGRSPVNSGNGTEQRNSIFIRSGQFIQFGVQWINGLLYKLKMRTNHEHTFLLGRGHLIAFNGFDYGNVFLFLRFFKKGFTRFRIKFIRSDQIIGDRRWRFTKHIGNDCIKSNITNGKGILETVFLLRLQQVNLKRYRVYSRRIRISLQGIKLPGTTPRRKRSPIHLESLALFLLPLTALTHLGLAMVMLIWSSKRLKTRIQYLPVDSIQTSKQELSRSHCLKRRISLLKVEKRFFW